MHLALNSSPPTLTSRNRQSNEPRRAEDFRQIALFYTIKIYRGNMFLEY